MRYFIFGFFTGALVLGSWSASATAQDTTPSADEPATIIQGGSGIQARLRRLPAR